MKLKKRLTQLIMLSVLVIMVSTSVYGDKLNKEDFAGLEGKDRTFYFVGLEFAFNKLSFKYSLKEEIEPIVAELESQFLEAIPVEALKSSIEEQLGLKLNTFAFNMKFESRKENGFFNDELEASERFIYHKWNVPSRKNRLIVTVFLFKLGSRIRINKAQIEIRFLVLNKEKTAYDTLIYSSKDITWENPQELYEIIKNNCIIQ
jgi:hypothetical protein